MLNPPLKSLCFFLLLLFFSDICQAEDDSAPAKFYDGLPIKMEKNEQPPPTVKPKESLGSRFFKIFTSEKTTSEKNAEFEKDLPKQEPTISAYRKKTSALDESFEVPDLELNSDIENDEFVSHTVGKNETLFSIATRFKVSLTQLAAWNAVSSPKQLYLGKKLKIFKNKQKHSILKTSKKPLESDEILRDNSQKTSIISINNKTMLKFYCHWPSKGKIIKNFSQTGGRGIEISGKAEQAIKATADGKVVAVSSGIYGHGIFIVIQHANRVISSYANNSRALVKTGQAVAEGQVIAEMGRVGRKPPSLEFEIRKNGVLVNPMLCLPKKT